MTWILVILACGLPPREEKNIVECPAMIMRVDTHYECEAILEKVMQKHPDYTGICQEVNPR